MHYHALGPEPLGDAAPLTSARRRVLEAVAEEAGTLAGLAQRLGGHPNTTRQHLEALMDGRLVDAHAVELKGPGRRPRHYQATAAGLRALAGGEGLTDYRELVVVIAHHLIDTGEPAERAFEIGRRWGQERAAGVEAPGTGDRGERAADRGGCASSHGDLVEPASAHGDLVEPTSAHGVLVERASEQGERAARAVMGSLIDLGFSPEADAGTIRLRTCPMLDTARDYPEVMCEIHRGLVRGVLDHAGSRADVMLAPFAEPGACVLRLGAPGDAASG